MIGHSMAVRLLRDRHRPAARLTLLPNSSTAARPAVRVTLTRPEMPIINWGRSLTGLSYRLLRLIMPCACARMMVNPPLLRGVAVSVSPPVFTRYDTDTWANTGVVYLPSTCICQ